jgi:ATP-dependent protease ClpP protease subunit
MKRRRLNSEEEEDEESHVKVIGNKIIFYGDVTNKSCFDIISALHEAKENISTGNQSSEIFLHICTHGGDVYPALGLISQIENFPSKIITVTEGCVASAGVLIALAGHERWMTKNSYMLIHEIRSSCWGRYSECQDDLQNQNLLMKDLKEYLVNKTRRKLRGQELDNVLRHDLLWNSDKCLKTKLVHKII